MEEDVDVYLEQATSGACYLESLVRARVLLNKLSNVEVINTKIEEIIMVELELALMGAEKARSEVLKQNKESVVRPIK